MFILPASYPARLSCPSLVPKLSHPYPGPHPHTQALNPVLYPGPQPHIKALNPVSYPGPQPHTQALNPALYPFAHSSLILGSSASLPYPGSHCSQPHNQAFMPLASIIPSSQLPAFVYPPSLVLRFSSSRLISHLVTQVLCTQKPNLVPGLSHLQNQYPGS